MIEIIAVEDMTKDKIKELFNVLNMNSDIQMIINKSKLQGSTLFKLIINTINQYKEISRYWELDYKFEEIKGINILVFTTNYKNQY